MTLFEYLAIAFSLVFSFSAKRLLAGLPFAMQAERRYGVHLTLSCLQLVATVMIFWLFWSFRDTTWTFPRFVLVLASPSLVYVNTCTLIPDEPSTVASWRDYYYEVRRRYFFGMLLWLMVVVAITRLVLEMPWTHPARAVQALLLVLGITGAASASPRVHAALALSLVLALLGAALVALQPGSLAS